MTQCNNTTRNFTGPLRLESQHTFHESSVGPAVVVEVRAVDVSQAVISQLGRVAETLQDRVHEALRTANITLVN